MISRYEKLELAQLIVVSVLIQFAGLEHGPPRIVPVPREQIVPVHHVRLLAHPTNRIVAYIRRRFVAHAH